jgi:RNA polymerase-binding transcription factor DksA
MLTRTPLKLWSLLWPTVGRAPHRARRPAHGTCRMCSHPIAEIRLKLMPRAELCAPCQKSVDARALRRT